MRLVSNLWWTLSSKQPSNSASTSQAGLLSWEYLVHDSSGRDKTWQDRRNEVPLAVAVGRFRALQTLTCDFYGDSHSGADMACQKELSALSDLRCVTGLTLPRRAVPWQLLGTLTNLRSLAVLDGGSLDADSCLNSFEDLSSVSTLVALTALRFETFTPPDYHAFPTSVPDRRVVAVSNGLVALLAPRLANLKALALPSLLLDATSAVALSAMPQLRELAIGGVAVPLGGPGCASAGLAQVKKIAVRSWPVTFAQLTWLLADAAPSVYVDVFQGIDVFYGTSRPKLVAASLRSALTGSLRNGPHHLFLTASPMRADPAGAAHPNVYQLITALLPALEQLERFSRMALKRFRVDDADAEALCSPWPSELHLCSCQLPFDAFHVLARCSVVADYDCEIKDDEEEEEEEWG